MNLKELWNKAEIVLLLLNGVIIFGLLLYAIILNAV